MEEIVLYWAMIQVMAWYEVVKVSEENTCFVSPISALPKGFSPIMSVAGIGLYSVQRP